MNLATKTLIGIFLGIVIGLGLSIYAPNVYEPLSTYIFGPVGSLFIKVITMVVIPLVFAAIVTSITSAGSLKKLGQMGTRTVSIFVITTMIACTIGILIATAIGPGVNITLPENAADIQGEGGGHGSEPAEPVQLPSLGDTILNIVPNNIFAAMAEGNMLQILTFSILIGITMTMLGDKVASLRTWISQLNELMMKLVQILMKVIPYAAFALVAEAMGAAGLDLLGSMAKYLIAVLIGLVIHVMFTYGSILSFISRTNPIRFFRKMIPAIGTAFATSSSAATLPVTKSCCENELKMSENVSSFVLPLGMTINMNGTSFNHGVAAIFVAQLNGIQLGLVEYVTIILISLLASVGGPAIPGGGVVSLSIVFLSVGLPFDGVGIAIVLGLFRLIDMFLTSANVLGDAVCASVVDRKLRYTEQRKEHSVVS